MNRIRKYFSLLVILFVPMALKAHIQSDQLSINQNKAVCQKIDGYMQTLTSLNRFSGTVLVAKDNQILLNRGYGYASHEFDVVNEPATKFRICSITKMFTAVAILQLKEKGLLNVQDTIDAYVPYFPCGDKITIHHLLSHTSGVSSGNLDFDMVVLPTTLEKIISFCCDQPLDFEPGSDYRYSNAGYFLLSAIIQKVSGTTYEAYIQENILNPSGMNDSFFRTYDYEILKNCAVGYCFNKKNQIVNGHYIYDGNGNGAGGLYCTAHDLYLFARALYLGTLLNQESLKGMFTSYHEKENYGYGCGIKDFMGHQLIEHGGALSSGFKSNLSLLIDDGIYIVILGNYFSSWINESRDALAAILLNMPYDMPSDQAIDLDKSALDEYVGVYDHPDFSDGYTIVRKGKVLYGADGKKLFPIGIDRCMELEQDYDNIEYQFIRNKSGKVEQLRIKGGWPYFEIRCQRLHECFRWPILSYQEYSQIRHDGPYSFKFADKKQKLYYFGANHSCDPSDAQYLLLEKFWNEFLVETGGQDCVVLVEGALRPVCSTKEEAIVSAGGEGGLITFLASEENIPVVCPEPDHLRKNLCAQFEKDTVDYRDFAHAVQQFNRYRTNDRLLEFDGFYQQRYGNLSKLNRMKQVHIDLFSVPFDPCDESFFYHITNPVEQKTVINKICRQASSMRDQHIVNKINELYKQGKNIFVVYGATHAVMQEPACRLIWQSN